MMAPCPRQRRGARLPPSACSPQSPERRCSHGSYGRSARERSGTASGASAGISGGSCCSGDFVRSTGRRMGTLCRAARTAFDSSTRSTRLCVETRSATPHRSARSSANQPRLPACATAFRSQPALTALAIENVFYTLSVAAMIAAGAIALLFAGAEAGGIQLPRSCANSARLRSPASSCCSPWQGG